MANAIFVIALLNSRLFCNLQW